MNNEKINILNLTQEELTELLVSLGLKKFYGKEVFIWLHKKIARSFDEMTNLSLKDREILKEKTYIPFFNLLKYQVSKIDKTEKFLFELEDGGTIETVLLRHKDSKNKEIRNTLCVSSQVGCPVKCSFCATGQSGYMRNLSVSEILNQVYTVERRLRKKGETLNNLVFMGMGEPLLNIDNLAKSLSIISNENGVNISKRKITISTSGVVVTFEYILIDNFNISETDANALADFIHQFDHVVNLIPYNEVEGVEHTRPSVKKIDKFYNYLKNVRKVNVTLRQEKGSDIDGACGQLRQRNKKGDN